MNYTNMRYKLAKRSQLKQFATLILFSVLNVLAYAQSPTHLPRPDPEPVNFFDSTANIIFFIGIPLLILIFYFLWRRNRPKK